MKFLFIAAFWFISFALSPLAYAVSPHQVIKWVKKNVSAEEMLRRVAGDKSTKRATLQEIVDMRMGSVPEAVIDFMANIGVQRPGKPRQPQPRSQSSSRTRASGTAADQAPNERLTVAVVIRLAKEHRHSLSAFIASLEVTRGQLALTYENARTLTRAKVTGNQLRELQLHNDRAVCRYTSDCVRGTRCLDDRCAVIPKGETTTSSSTVQRESRTPSPDEARHLRRFGKGFIMGGLGLTRSTAVIPATGDAEAEEETQWGVDLALRLAYVTPAGIYIGGRVWYDSALANGEGDGSGALLLGYLARLSERYPLFLDIRGDVSSVNDEVTASAGLGLAVALGEEHPIFLHTELVSFESAGASSRGNVSMGVRF